MGALRWTGGVELMARTSLRQQVEALKRTIALKISNDPDPLPCEAGLPMPRLQLRWQDLPMNDPAGFGKTWICRYELIIPLREHDIRAEREGKPDRPFHRVLIGTTRAGCSSPPEFAPYRDGAHAAWDGAVLGGLPVFVITPDGRAAKQPAE